MSVDYYPTKVGADDWIVSGHRHHLQIVRTEGPSGRTDRRGEDILQKVFLVSDRLDVIDVDDQFETDEHGFTRLKDAISYAVDKLKEYDHKVGLHKRNPMTAEELRRGAKTAIARFKPSVPMSELERRGLLRGRMLDYGAGRGFDADHFGLEKFDPTYWPTRPRGKFDTITCNYVLNVVPPEAEGEILADIAKLLEPDGVAYITVRRDVYKDGLTSTGTYQRRVYLDLPFVARKKGAYETYLLRKS